jgi:hypothetical protein
LEFLSAHAFRQAHVTHRVLLVYESFRTSMPEHAAQETLQAQQSFMPDCGLSLAICEMILCALVVWNSFNRNLPNLDLKCFS